LQLRYCKEYDMLCPWNWIYVVLFFFPWVWSWSILSMIQWRTLWFFRGRISNERIWKNNLLISFIFLSFFLWFVYEVTITTRNSHTQLHGLEF
jgi:hypothetical protein